MRDKITRGSELVVSLIKTYTKKLRLLKVNRELLVFIVFLGIACLFWFLRAFQENATIQIDYKIQIANIPENLVVTTNIPENISSTVSGRGYELMTYSVENNDKSIVIDYDELTKTGNTLIVDNAILRRSITQKMPGAINFVSATPSQITLPYSNGEKKKVPVIYAGNASTSSQQYIYNIDIAPDSVDIYAPADIYKSVNAIYTEEIDFNDIEHTKSVKIALNPQNGVKAIPDSVEITFNVELFTEKTIAVPIHIANAPANTLVHTFPSKASVTCRVSTKNFHNVKEDSFSVIVDFDNITADTPKCKLILQKAPTTVSNVKIVPESVEYIIEHTTRQ